MIYKMGGSSKIICLLMLAAMSCVLRISESYQSPCSLFLLIGVGMGVVPFAAAQSGSSEGSSGSECPNACSGNGGCAAKGVCNCWKNWMGNDCSLRMTTTHSTHTVTAYTVPCMLFQLTPPARLPTASAC